MSTLYPLPRRRPQRPVDRFFRDYIYTILMFVFIVAVLGIQIVQWRDCSDKGGEYVRGMIWMKCVDEDLQGEP